MKLKSLVKTFSYTELVKECEKQDWRLPTLEEAKTLETTHDAFWIQTKVPIYNEYDHVYYSKSRNQVGYRHKNHRMTTAIIAMPQVCSRCEYHSSPRGCLKYGFTIPTIVEEFGCTTGFERKDGIPDGTH